MINSVNCDQNSGFVIYQETIPGIGRLISQGVLAGALSSWICFVFKILFFPHNAYVDSILAAYLLFFLAFGGVFGFIVAVVLWTISHITQRRLGWTVRLVITSVLTSCVCSLRIFSAGTTNVDYSPIIAFATVAIVTVGLITGSHYRPGHAFLHGRRSSPGDHLWSIIAIGFLLRLLSVFLCLQFLLGVVFMATYDRFEWFVLPFLGYVLINTFFYFDNAQSFGLMVLSLLTNAALIVVLCVYSADLRFGLYVFFSYLMLWWVFLLGNRGGFTPLMSSITEQLRYYELIR